MSIPEHPDEMSAILDAIDGGLEQGEKVYIHCWGGIGRTGTVVGCYLVRRGLSGDQALERVQQLWTTCEKYPRYRESPQAPSQFEFVRRWEQWER